jgi:hypothetical protein
MGSIGRFAGRWIVSAIGPWETVALASTVFHVVKLAGGEVYR